MKYREEVLAKIFTYVTVFLLLGIVVFEACLLQFREKQSDELEDQVRETELKVQEMTDDNASLQAQKAELEAFREEWEPYTGYLGNEEIEKMSVNLFARTGLIPQEAQDALADWIREQERLKEDTVGYERPDAEDGEVPDGAEGTEEAEGIEEADGGSGRNGKDESGKDGSGEAEDDAAEETGRSLWLSYRSPEGEQLFLPINTGSGDGSCLVYTAVYERLTGARMELLFGIRYSERTGIERDENGRIAWRCLAYRLMGSAWQGIGEETEPEGAVPEEEKTSK